MCCYCIGGPAKLAADHQNPRFTWLRVVRPAAANQGEIRAGETRTPIVAKPRSFVLSVRCVFAQVVVLGPMATVWEVSEWQIWGTRIPITLPQP